nr:transcriptional regulator [Antrihabitans stalactiti]
MIVLVIVSFVGCLALAWWQWDRFESASGTGQNLGYALQWPLFAAFVLYAYRRFVQLEAEAADTDAAPKVEGPREIPADLLPQRPTARTELDPAMVEYNRYLAELAARENIRSDT